MMIATSQAKHDISAVPVNNLTLVGLETSSSSQQQRETPGGTPAAHAPHRQVSSGGVWQDLDRFLDSFDSFGLFRSPVDVVVPHERLTSPPREVRSSAKLQDHRWVEW